MMEIALTTAGIVVPSILFTLVVRRWVVRLDWRIAAICLVLAVGFVARGVFTSGLPVPLDEVVRGWPYRGLFGDNRGRVEPQWPQWRIVGRYWIEPPRRHLGSEPVDIG